MGRLVAVAAVLTVLFSSTVFAQRHPAQGSYPPYGFRVFTDWQPSGLRLDVSPDNAKVFVDHHYAGAVNEFNSFRRLSLHAGPHLVEIRKPGFRSLTVDVSLFPNQNVTLSRTLQPLYDGDNLEADAEAGAPSLESGALPPAADGPSGALRFDVKVKDAAVYADGFYVGIVSDFNGSQHMMLTQGTHRLVLKRDGYQTIEANVTIESDRPLTYRTALAAATRTPVQLTASSAIR